MREPNQERAIPVLTSRFKGFEQSLTDTGQRGVKRPLRTSASGREKDFHTANRVMLNLLQIKKVPGTDDPMKPPWHPRVIKHYKGDKEAAWRAFEELLAKQADVDHAQAERAVKAFRKRLRNPLYSGEGSVWEAFGLRGAV